MAEPVILTWNPANWLTVVLMFAAAYFAAVAASKFLKARAEQAA